MRVRLPVCRDDELGPGVVRVVPISPDGRGKPREALVVRDIDGVARCYVNRCQHVSIPLDGGTRDFFTKDGARFRCGTHGAEFRLEDGYCVTGPCLGQSLRALEVELLDGQVAIYDDGGDD